MMAPQFPDIDPGLTMEKTSGGRVRRVVGGRKALAHKFPWQVRSTFRVSFVTLMKSKYAKRRSSSIT